MMITVNGEEIIGVWEKGELSYVEEDLNEISREAL